MANLFHQQLTELQSEDGEAVDLKSPLLRHQKDSKGSQSRVSTSKPLEILQIHSNSMRETRLWPSNGSRHKAGHNLFHCGLQKSIFQLVSTSREVGQQVEHPHGVQFFTFRLFSPRFWRLLLSKLSSPRS